MVKAIKRRAIPAIVGALLLSNLYQYYRVNNLETEIGILNQKLETQKLLNTVFQNRLEWLLTQMQTTEQNRLNEIKEAKALIKEWLKTYNKNRIIVIKNVKLTFYSNDEGSINKAIYRDGLTATLIPANVGVIAVDSNLIPYGSVVYIPKLHRFFVAVDTGSAIKGKHIDVFVESREKALKLGTQYSDVIICGKVDVFKLRKVLMKISPDYKKKVKEVVFKGTKA